MNTGAYLYRQTFPSSVLIDVRYVFRFMFLICTAVYRLSYYKGKVPGNANSIHKYGMIYERDYMTLRSPNFSL